MIKIMVVDDSLIVLKTWEFCPWAKNHIATYENLVDAYTGLKNNCNDLQILVCDLSFPGKSRNDVFDFLKEARRLSHARIWISTLARVEPLGFLGLEPFEIVTKGPPETAPPYFQ